MAGHAMASSKVVPEALLFLLLSHALLGSQSLHAWSWSRSWIVSGAAPLSYLLLAGEAHHRRVLPWAPLSVLLLLINLAHAASATSWLFFSLFAVACWPLVFFSSLFQFDKVANLTRNSLRHLLRFVQFAADRVALFDLPALEIDTEVAGLMVIRGVTLSLSTLTLVAHGVEVGIKLSDDMELALQTDRVTVQLFRSIHVADVYGNVKGGAYEQTFAELEGDTRTPSGQVLMDKDRPLIRAAAAAATKSVSDGHAEERQEQQDQAESNTADQQDSIDTDPMSSDTERPAIPPRPSESVQPSIDNAEASASASTAPPLPPRKVPSLHSLAPSIDSTVSDIDQGLSENGPGQGGKTTMADKLTNGHAPRFEATEAHEILKQTTSIVGDDHSAEQLMKKRVEEIQQTSQVVHAERRARRIVTQKHAKNESTEVDLDNDRHVRAAICSQLHRKPSIQHPPEQSIRVTTLQNIGPPWLARFFHCTPLLLRLLLNPLAYFHPITIDSITVGASGKWMQSMLGSELFKTYADRSGDVRTLRDRAFSWLSDANFVIGLGDFAGQGAVPINTENDIESRMRVGELTLYRTVPQEATLKKAVQLGGADATVVVPSMLLPHHDHLLPTDVQRTQRETESRRAIRRHDSQPKIVQAKRALEKSIRDETSCRISAHLHLPAVFDQELLNFISALVKASKMIEFEQTLEQATNAEIRSVNDLKRFIHTGFKESVKKATVNAAANDRWIAKMVGRITSKLGNAQGDVGYSGTIPVSLKPYRDAATPGESKLLP